MRKGGSLRFPQALTQSPRSVSLTSVLKPRRQGGHRLKWWVGTCRHLSANTGRQGRTDSLEAGFSIPVVPILGT
jgi:hypothetical protein